MADETEGFQEEEAPQPRKVKARKPVFRVRRVTEDGNDPQVTKFDTVEEAHRYVVTNHPRGREVYVEHPDGYREHYSDDLAYQGHPDGGWQELSEDETE